MKLRIEPSIFALFPEVLVGVVRLHDADNRGASAALRDLLESERLRVRQALAGVDLAADPCIAAWREAYRRFGANPRRHASSIENLLRRVLAGAPLAPINKLVDLYILVSLRHRLPVGGEDLDALRGDVVLARAGPGEAAIVLLGESAAHSPHPGEVIYRDEAGALCRRWNWKEAERTKLTAETRQALLVIEALPPVARPALETALAELAELARTHCGARTTTSIAGAHAPQLDLGEL